MPCRRRISIKQRYMKENNGIQQFSDGHLRPPANLISPRGQYLSVISEPPPKYASEVARDSSH